jgi:thioredoxin-related protein
MRFVASMVLVMFVALLAAPAAVADPPEVDTAAVLRLGDMVQHVDGIRADGEDLFVQAMATPENDADKWFISVLTMANCQPCERLKRDFAESEWLRALADPTDQKRSWAHYTVYSREDKSQAFRFEKLKITGYPTILVQPPRSGKYGEPSTVVYQSTYGGDPKQLATNIANSVRVYVSKMSGGASTTGPNEAALQSPASRYDPPWRPPNRDDVPSVDGGPVSFPDGLPLIPPPSILSGVAGLGTVTVVVLSIVATLALVFLVPMAISAWSAASARKRADRETAAAQQRAMAALLAKMSAPAASMATASDKSAAASGVA